MNPITQSDQEILSALIGQRESKRIYRGSLASILLKTEETGSGFKKLLAAQEFVRRALREELGKRDSLSRPEKVRDYLRLVFAGKEHEVFVLVLLDAQNRFIKVEELSRGTISQAPVYSREVVKCTLKNNAASVIFAHNHTSGVAEPSQEDYRTTQRLKDALALVDVKVHDHFVVSGNECLSFAERGRM